MQWRKNRVAIGAVVLAAMLGLTIWAVATRDEIPADATIDIPVLEVDGDSIVSLDITRPAQGENEVVVLSEVAGDWRVTSPLEAEADESNVKAALDRLAGLTLVGIAATRSENYPRLEVDDAQAVTVVATMKEPAPALTLRIGKYANGVSMVRVDERPEVFTVKGSLRYPFDRELKDWRDRHITRLEPAKVQRVTFESPKGNYSFHRVDGAWAPAEEQKPIKDFDPKQVEGLVSSAARLSASGFAQSDVSVARAGLGEPSATVTLELAPSSPNETEAAEPSPVTPEIVELELGEETSDGTESYVRRAGKPTIFIISQYLADRLQPAASAFKAPDEPPPAGAPGANQPAMPQGQPQLSPEMMEQLRQQILQQQRQPQPAPR